MEEISFKVNPILALVAIFSAKQNHLCNLLEGIMSNISVKLFLN